MGASAALAIAAYGAYSSRKSAKEGMKATEDAARRQEALTPPPQQDLKTPEAGRRKNSGNLAGVGSTLLTGVGGVSPGSLNLGRTLLGG